MRADLPEAFVRRVLAQLDEESEPFLQSYDAPRTFGLRINTLKGDASETPLRHAKGLFGLEPMPWCPTGYYYDDASRPGKHPYHAAGLYYIQEPSAMTAAELLDPQPGELVLDLAAAPGGKTTQIAAKMAGAGVLVANEIHPARAKILSENVERMGIARAIVTQASPDELSRRFPERFDRIMLDAPCSGEGMFRKDERAIAEWSPDHVAMCAVRQADILDHAALLLKPGGRLVYSTCTFNREENEEAIAAFCAKYPAFALLRTERVWPHKARGEGHFVAVLQKAGGTDLEAEPPQAADAGAAAGEYAAYAAAQGAARGRGRMADGDDASAAHLRAEESREALRRRERLADGDSTPAAHLRAESNRGSERSSAAGKRGRRSRPAAAPASLAADMALAHAFAADALLGGLPLGPGEPLRFGDALYWLPHPESGSPITAGDLHGLKVARPGLHLGDLRKNRLEPAHALALAAGSGAAAWVQSYPGDAPEIAAYLRGETIAAQPGSDGWGLVAVDGLPLGWGKGSGGQIKNHLPKGLRWPGFG